MEENCHAGHRQRVRDKVRKSGISGLANHEILEFLLFYVIPRRNTNLIAHKIYSHFESFAAISKASVEEISKIAGISPKSAAFIKYLPQLSEFIFSGDDSENGRLSLSSSSEVTAYFRNGFSGENAGSVKLSCLTPALQLMSTVTLTSGGITSTPVFMRKLVSVIIEKRSRDVILAFDHPNGSFIPEKHELAAIGSIIKLLTSLDIRLVDVIIVSDDGIALSLRDSGYLSNIKLGLK